MSAIRSTIIRVDSAKRRTFHDCPIAGSQNYTFYLHSTHKFGPEHTKDMHILFENILCPQCMAIDAMCELLLLTLVKRKNANKQKQVKKKNHLAIRDTFL